MAGRTLLFLCNLYRLIRFVNMMKKISIILLGAALLGSCVPSSEFSQLSRKSNQLQSERDKLMAENEFLTVENREMKGMIDRVEDQKEQYVRDSIRIYKKVEELEKEVANLERKYADLEATHEALLRGNARETRRLLNELQTNQEDLTRKEQLLKELEANVNQQKQDVSRLKAELEARNANLLEMEKMLQEKDQVLDDLKSKVADALMGFEGQGLTVTRKNGKVYVSLDEKLLFRSASWDIDANGRNALRNLAAVLERNPDIQITIEGHTDNVPYNPSGGQLRDNWDLSVKRATTVVRVLLESAKIDPKRLTAAGRSQYLPVDDSNGHEGHSPS